jgi:hypothetical protein
MTRSILLISLALLGLGASVWFTARAPLTELERGAEQALANGPQLGARVESRSSLEPLVFRAPPASFELPSSAPLEATITGLVLQTNRLPAAYARIEVRTSASHFQVAAGQDGRFEIHCAVSEPHDLEVRELGRKPTTATAHAVQPGTRDLVLQLQEAARTRLVVHDADGKPVERYAVALISERTRASLAFLSLDEHFEGEFEFAPPKEDFFVEVRALGYRPERQGPFRAGAPPMALSVTPSTVEEMEEPDDGALALER